MPEGIVQAVAALGHIQEGQGAAIGNAQGDIQITQAHIAVDAQNLGTGAGKGDRNAGTGGCFTGSAFTGQDGNN